MPDLKVSLPITILVSVGSSIATGLIGMKTHEAVLTSRVDGIERAIASQQVQMQSLTSRNEFLQFREDVLTMLRRIDEKVSR